jgi:ribosomal protein L1
MAFVPREITVNDDEFNISIRKFLKMVGVSSQRDIEQAVAKALADGSIKGNESFPVYVTLQIDALKLNVRFDGEIRLE